MTEGYIGDARLDELARISIGLMKEIWLLRDRQLVLERLLEGKGVVERREIELDEPDARASAEISLEVDGMIARVFEGAFPTGVPDLDSLRARAAEELAAEKTAGGG